MTVFSVRVTASSDDAEENNANTQVLINSSDLELVKDADLAGTSIVGCRFLGVTIAQGDTINSATVTFTVDEVTTAGTPSVRIFCEDVDDGATFVATNANLSGRTRTTASADWSVPGFANIDDEHASADFAAAVQEVIDRVGWASGNDLNVLFDNLSGTEPRTAEAYDGETASAPLLEIDYGAGAGGSILAQMIQQGLYAGGAR